MELKIVSIKNTKYLFAIIIKIQVSKYISSHKYLATRMQRLGTYTNLESLYQGYGFAAGLHSDPESMRTAAFDFQTPMTVIEIKGKIFYLFKIGT